MPRVLLLGLVVLVTLFGPSARADEPLFRAFDAAALDAPERRLVQAALAAAGDYHGALDGAWGAESAEALAAFAAREFDGPPLAVHVAALVLQLAEAVRADGWDFRYLPELGISLALPLARLGPPEPEEGGERRWSEDGRLTVLTHDFDAEAARRWHGAAIKANAEAAALVTERGAARLVTRGVLRDGRAFYTRSDSTGAGWATVLLVATPEDAGALGLAAASIGPGRPAPWDLPQGGHLAGLVAAAGAFLSGTDALPASLPDAVPDAWPTGAPAAAAPPSSTGTGFYLGAETVVTAEHVVAGCARVSLPDGRDFALLAADPDLDVALLRAPAPARHWLSLAEDELRLGQQVHAAGFPYYSIAGTSLNLTSGNVSALAGVDDDRRFFTFSAPVQPGNSGGPLVDSHGAVRGLVVARLSEEFIAEATGTLPQNVNYALGEGELERFLDGHGVSPAPGGLGGYDIAEGAPAAFGEAVVPIVCR
ncbi:serine protease [Amaricoccus sp.]|uniref:S1C family serine protease n=1 Tax=Amaricoccus sp. TaxID=1872485 RepID=UPI002D1FBAA9|nr:serine protease [Amaricoccus sp.]